MTKRFWFLGSGFFGARCLEFIANEVRPLLVVTPPPKRAGRGLGLREMPVAALASAMGLEVHPTPDASTDAVLQRRFEEEPPDFLLVVDFSQKIRDFLLSAPKYGCLNIHPSLLPAYRGAAPIQRALLDGAEVTGVSLFRLVEKMDAGPILAQVSYRILDTDTAGDLLVKLAQLGSEVFLKKLEEGYDHWVFVEQNEAEATYAPKINPSEFLIDWQKKADFLFNQIRALSPLPGAFTWFRHKRLKILSSQRAELEGPPGEILGTDEKGFPLVGCGVKSLILLSVQPEGRRKESADEWFRGSRLEVGDHLGE